MNEKCDCNNQLKAAKIALSQARASAAAASEDLRDHERAAALFDEQCGEAERVYESFIAAGSLAATECEQSKAVAQAMECNTARVRVGVQVAIANARLAVRRRAHEQSVDLVRTAEAAVRAAAEEWIQADMIERANSIRQLQAALMKEVDALRLLSNQSALNTPINRLERTLPAVVVSALAEAPVESGLNTPINLLRKAFNSNLYAERLNELMEMTEA